MKPLHLVTSNDDLRPAMCYIHVRNGNVVATDAHRLVIFPLNEVFPEDAGITNEDHFYILGTDWKRAGMHKAVYMQREGNRLFAYDKKHREIGSCELKVNPDFTYPNWEEVLPAPDVELQAVTVTEIALNAKFLAELQEVLGAVVLKLSFIGNNKAIIVQGKNDDGIVNATCIIMPCMLF